MGDQSGIEWTEATWNPVIGCRRVSEGCRNCYAERQARRIVEMHEGSPYGQVVQIDEAGKPRPRWNGRAKLLPERLDQPLRWRRKRRIFVNSMSDLFHEDLTNEEIAAVFGVMAAAPRHTFQVLTKRAQRMLEWFEWYRDHCEEVFDDAPGSGLVQHAAHELGDGSEASYSGWCDRLANLMLDAAETPEECLLAASTVAPWPLPNVWLGVSVEDQATADERIPLLLGCPAAVRWVSYEPALGPVDFARLSIVDDPQGSLNALTGLASGMDEYIAPGLDWIVIGGESGPGARPFDVDWARAVLAAAGHQAVPVFIKQLGARPVVQDYMTCGADPDVLCPLKSRKGGNPDEWPADLRVREWPGAAS